VSDPQANSKTEDDSMTESEEFGLGTSRSPDIVYVLDPKGRFIFVEGALEPLTGYSPEELLGRHFTALISPQDPEVTGRHFNERRTGNRATRAHQVRLRVRDNQPGDFDVRYRPMELHAFGMWDKPPSAKDKKFFGTYGRARDMTSRVRVEEGLKSAYENIPLHPDQRKALSGMLIDLLDKQKERIAVELHDHIGQSLVSLKMDLEAMNGAETAAAENINQGIRAAKEKAVQIMKDLRHVTYGMKPAGLDAFGLTHSLNSLFKEVEVRSALVIRFFIRDVPERVNSHTRFALFRIAQEAIENVMRHAHASEVHVNLIGKVGLLSLSVEDNGIGFDVQAVSTSTLGLVLMRERAIQLGGTFAIDSAAGRGTHILAEIPL
jgi:PAS domain S-box-containing protein